MMPFQIVKVVKGSFGIIEEEMKAYQDFEYASEILYRLANMHHWKHDPGVLIDKFIDGNNVYYVREKK